MCRSALLSLRLSADKFRLPVQCVCGPSVYSEVPLQPPELKFINQSTCVYVQHALSDLFMQTVCSCACQAFQLQRRHQSLIYVCSKYRPSYFARVLCTFLLLASSFSATVQVPDKYLLKCAVCTDILFVQMLCRLSLLGASFPAEVYVCTHLYIFAMRTDQCVCTGAVQPGASLKLVSYSTSFCSCVYVCI